MCESVSGVINERNGGGGIEAIISGNINNGV